MVGLASEKIPNPFRDCLWVFHSVSRQLKRNLGLQLLALRMGVWGVRACGRPRLLIGYGDARLCAPREEGRGATWIGEITLPSLAGRPSFLREKELWSETGPCEPHDCKTLGQAL